MFGLSFSEFLVIGIVALVAVGPNKLPGMLRTLGEWLRKLRNMTYDIRAQSGIDEILRAEGLHGGVSELKTLIRSAQTPFLNLNLASPPPAPGRPNPSSTAVPDMPGDPDPLPAPRYEDPYANLEIDATREYPPEGPDAYGALPDDLVDDGIEHPEPIDVLNAAQALPPDEPAAAEAPGPATSEAPDPAPSPTALEELNPPSASS